MLIAGKWKKGQRVAVKEAYVNGDAGAGVIVSEGRVGHNKGLVCVEMAEGNIMYVDPERIISEQDHWDQVRREFMASKTRGDGKG